MNFRSVKVKALAHPSRVSFATLNKVKQIVCVGILYAKVLHYELSGKSMGDIFFYVHM
jgi:hypothetical protein